MATKYGQAAIEAWGKKSAATKLLFKAIGVAVLIVIVFAVIVDKGL